MSYSNRQRVFCCEGTTYFVRYEGNTPVHFMLVGDEEVEVTDNMWYSAKFKSLEGKEAKPYGELVRAQTQRVKAMYPVRLQ